jgi:hypothetical protein
MFTVLDATNALGGSTTKLLISPRNIRKVGVFSRNLRFMYSAQSRKISFGTREAGEGESLEIGRSTILISSFHHELALGMYV